jgi:subtilisin family serine protease
MKNHKPVFNLLLFAFCATLPMTPIMASAVNNIVPGQLADYATFMDVSTVPARNTEYERWDLDRIQVPEAWELADGQDVVIAVLDSGIDAAHPALKDKIIQRVNFSNSSEPDLKRGHGTHVAGLIAAAFEDAARSGVAYNARLLDVQVAQNDGTTDALKVAKGIIWAVDNGAQVINISIVIAQPYDTLAWACDYAWQKGCLIIASAGNSGSTAPAYPAAYPHVISVAASNKKDALASWSNRGEWVDVSAPGVDICSTLPDGCYGSKSGSSFSAALVSGEAALLFQHASDVNEDGRLNDEVSDAILLYCDEIDGLDYPERRINVLAAATAGQPQPGVLTESSAAVPSQTAQEIASYFWFLSTLQLQ